LEERMRRAPRRSDVITVLTSFISRLSCQSDPVYGQLLRTQYTAV
jgi:hypothetical protein